MRKPSTPRRLSSARKASNRSAAPSRTDPSMAPEATGVAGHGQVCGDLAHSHACGRMLHCSIGAPLPRNNHYLLTVPGESAPRKSGGISPLQNGRRKNMFGSIGSALKAAVSAAAEWRRREIARAELESLDDR